MNILILGGGGREHSLAWAVKQNPKCDRLIVAPGNAGIAAIAECASFDICDGGMVVTFAEENAVDFVIIGPEAPLAAGVADRLRDAGILTFGPSEAAARLEASKAFTKEMCDAAGAPTAAWARFTMSEPAKDYIRDQGAPIVVKADGLAAGKGVIVAMDEETALAAVDDMFSGEFGMAGAEVVIEEFMAGEEASFFVLCDGLDALAIGTAQDHKRVGDGDTGPNTGGMGAYSPAPILTDALQAKVMEQIIRPTLRVMAERGTPFQGVLYAGLMIEDGKARLVEYNVRFGDPECQVLMMRLGAQAFDLIHAGRRGTAGGVQGQLGRRPCAERGDGGAGISGRLCQGVRDPRPRRPARRQRAYGLSCRYPVRRGADSGQWRPGAECHGARRIAARGAGAGLCDGRRRRLARGVLSPRYRLAGALKGAACPLWPLRAIHPRGYCRTTDGGMPCAGPRAFRR